MTSSTPSSSSSSSSSSGGGSRSGGKRDPAGTAGPERPGGPSSTELLEKISTLEQTLATLIRLSGGAESPPSTSLPLPVIDPETARRQALTRLRYRIVGGLLGRKDAGVPFAPAFRCISVGAGGGLDTVKFFSVLPSSAKFVILRSGGLSERVDIQSDKLTVFIDKLKDLSLEPIEIYDEKENMILVGSRLEKLPTGNRRPC